MKTSLQKNTILWIQILLLSIVCIVQLLAQQPGAEAEIRIVEPCTCLNNSTQSGNGQFLERIVIDGLSGENWTVLNVSGLYYPGASVPPLPTDRVSSGDVFLVDDMDPTKYFLDVVHVDAQGYQLTVSNGDTVLQLSNRCFYAEPIINLVDNYCINHPQIPMNVTALPFSGAFEVLVNGNPAMTFHPAVLGAGQHNVNFTFASAPLNDSMPGCTVSRNRQITVAPNYVGGLSCTHINVGLNEFGWAKIVPDMLLLGNYGCSSTFIIDIMGKDTDTLWCSDIGKTFMVKVTDPVRNNTCWGNVTPEDKMGPRIRCQDTTIFCGTDFFNRPFTDFISVYDNCDPNFQIILQQQSPFNNPTCNPNFSASITRTYRATDKYGNVSHCTHTIYFSRPALSDIQAPSDTILKCNQLTDLSPNNLGFPHINGQEIGFFCEFSISHNEFSYTTCPGSRVIKRNFWVTDICSRQMRMLTQTIQIIDDEAPVIVCPPASSLFNQPGQCFAIYSLPAVEVSDNCAATNQIQLFRFVNGNLVSPGVNQVSLPVGANQLTIWAQDPCLNIGVCNYTINVVDNEAPVLACNPITVAIGATGFAIVGIDSLDNNYLDNCGIIDTLIARMDQPVFGKSVTYTCADLNTNQILLIQVTDQSGNSNTCMVSVTVQDKLGPNVVYCPPSVQLACNLENPDLTDVPVFEDNCDPTPSVVKIPDVNVLGCCDTYTLTRTWIASDNAGNTSSCVQIIEIRDQLAPVLQCLEAYTVSLDNDGLGMVVLNEIFSEATDICCENLPAPDFTSRLFTCSDLGTTQFIVISVTDGCGNTGTCEVAITVIDELAPEITNCGDITLQASELETCDPAGLAEWVISNVLEASDNCDENPSILFMGTGTIFESFCDGTQGIYRAEYIFETADASGNINPTACTLIITYAYDIAPAIVRCTTDITVFLDEDGAASLNRNTVFEAEHVGPCDIIGVTYSPGFVQFDCEDIGNNEITFTATQECTIQAFSTATCVVNVNVVDSMRPELICPAALTLSLDSNGNLSLNALNLEIEATDNCGTPELEITPQNLTCNNLGFNSIFVTATDEAGNTAFCSISVTVVDVSGPNFMGCMDVTLQLSDVGTCAVSAYSDPALYGLSALDACDGPISIGSGTTSDVVNFCNPDNPGEASGTVTFTVSDLSGNTSICQIQVTVVNDVAPELECIPSTLVFYVDEFGQLEVDIIDLIYGTSFPLNCSELERSISVTADRDLNFTCDDLRLHTIILTATVCGGVSTTCEVLISVEDEDEPTITCPPNVTISCGEEPLTVVGFNGVFAPSEWSQSIDGDGEILFNGDQVTLVSANDDTEDAETNLCIIIPEEGILRFSYTYTTLDLDGPEWDPFGYTLNGTFFQLTDDLGADVQVGTIIIPVLSTDQFCFSQRSLDGEFGAATSIAMEFMYSTIGLPEFDDNCSATVAFEDDIIEGCGNSAIIFRTWRATDTSNNNRACSQLIEIIDIIPPAISCPVDPIVVYLDEDGLALFDVEEAIASTDNCGEVNYSIQTINLSCMDIGDENYTLIVSDECGNSASCTFTLRVEDDEAPVFTNCQSEITFFLSEHNNNCSPGYYVAPARVPEPVVVDNCSMMLIIERTPSVIETLCEGTPGVGVGQIIFTATDASGNTAVCISRINVVDNVDPIVDCVQSAEVFLDGNGIGLINTANLVAGISDDCDNNAEVIANDVNFTCADIGAQNVLVTVTDCAGNTGTCIASVTVLDTIPPTIECAASYVLDLDNNGEAAIVNPTVLLNSPPVDNCSSSFTYELSRRDFDCTHIGPNSIILTVRDEQGNVSTCMITIEVEDNISPIVSCPLNFSISNTPGLCSGILNFTLPTASDNCDLNPMVTSNPALNSIIPVGPNNIILTASDASGNTSTCNFTVTVLDNTPPLAICPSNVTVNTDPGVCNAVVNFSIPTPTDNCPGVVSAPNVPSGSNFELGINTIIVTATDVAGNTNTCQFTITVVDNQAPLMSCPLSITVANDIGECSAIVSFSAPTASDNCEIDTLIVSHVSGGVYPVGITNVIAIATDNAGNSAICSFSITVRDEESPVAECPMNTEVETELGLCDALVSFQIPSGTDNCGVASVVSVPQSNTRFNRGTTIVTVIVTDGSGNSNTCTFNVVVVDNEMPVAVCPNNITEFSDPGLCSAEVSFSLPASTDNCPGVMFIASPLSGSVFAVGETTVTVTATDASGNTNTCSFTVEVIDDEIPSITCPTPNNPYSTNIGACEATLNFSAIANDNCGVDTLIYLINGQGIEFPYAFSVGSTSVIVDALDENGNRATCSFTVSVEDNEAPQIVCPQNIEVDNEEGECFAIVLYNEPEGTDNCSGANTIQIAGLESGEEFPVGVTTNIFRVTALNGQIATCSFTVTVNDVEAPLISCPDNINQDNDPGLCSAVVNFTAPMGTDNCPGSVTVLSQGQPDGSTFPVGMTTNVYTVTAANGQSATCSFTVTVNDIELPLIICPGDIIQNNDPGICGAVVQFTPPVGTDNCEGANTVLTSGLASGSLFPVGTTTNVYTVTAANGQSATCSFMVAVEDNELPVISCPDDLTVDTDLGVCEAIVAYITPLGTDNCSGAMTDQVEGLPSGSVFPIGSTVNRFVVIDTNDQSASCSFTVTVVDNEAPQIICPASVTVNNEVGECFAVVNYPAIEGTDNCSGANTIQIAGLESGEEFPVGVTTNIFRVTALNGQIATCSFTVTVNDVEAPLVSCPANILIGNAINLCGRVVDFAPAAVSDNCGIASVVTAPLSGSFFAVGIHTVNIMVTDLSNNTASCSFSIEVRDVQSPQVTCSANSSMVCSEDLDAKVRSFSFVANDNCGVVSRDTAVIPLLSACGTGTVQVVFTATDAAGLFARCTRTITVTPDPNFILLENMIDFPEDVVLPCGGNISPDSLGYPLLVGELLCADVLFSFIDAVAPVPADGCTLITRTWTAFDACSMQSVSGIQLIRISESTPQFAFVPDDITAFVSAGTCEALVIADPVGLPTCPEDLTISNDFNLNGANASGIYPIGETMVIFTLTNACGNSNTAEFVITVLDTISPAAICPPSFAIDCNEDINEVLSNVDFMDSDNCGVASRDTLVVMVGNGCNREYAVTYIVEDTSGNSSSCSLIVSINLVSYDPMDIQWPADYFMDCSLSSDTSVSGVPILPLACGDFIITFIDDAPLLGAGAECDTIIRNWTVRDECLYDPLTGEGEYTWEQFIFVPDYSEIFALVPNDRNLTFANDPGLCGADVIVLFPNPSFCAPDITISNSFNENGNDASDFYPIGTTEVIFTIRSGCGIEFTETVSILVQDLESPELFCGDPVRTVSCEVDLQAFAESIDITVTENCDYTIAVTLEFNLDACGLGQVIATYIATDLSENDAECEIILNVVSGSQSLDIDDVDWPIAQINLNDCGADISPAALESMPDLLRAYYCLGLEFLFDDVEQTPIGDECRRVERTWYLVSNCSGDTLGIFVQLILIDPNNVSPIVIEGFTRTEYGQAVAQTQVIFAGHENIVQTNESGHYLNAILSTGFNVIQLIPMNNNGAAWHGVSISDVNEINRYIHGKQRYLSPYQIIAADVNRDGVVDIKDAAMIREIIVGHRQDFPYSNWRFVDNDYKFLDPQNPLKESFPETKWLECAVTKHFRANFVGVKMGDINNSFQTGMSLRNQLPAQIWEASAQILKAGEWNEIPVYSRDASSLLGVQLTIQAALQNGERIQVVHTGLGDMTINASQAEKGLVSLAWSADETGLDPSTPVFFIRWFATSDRSIEGQLQFGSSITRAIQYMEGNRKGIPVLEIRSDAAVYEMYQNEPNPASWETRIPYQLAEAGQLTLEIFDLQGRLVHSQISAATSGKGRLFVNLRAISEPGVYLYRLQSGQFSATKKMLIVR